MSKKPLNAGQLEYAAQTSRMFKRSHISVSKLPERPLHIVTPTGFHEYTKYPTGEQLLHDARRAAKCGDQAKHDALMETYHMRVAAKKAGLL